MIGVISNLCTPTLNILLYGNQTLSFDVNQQMFKLHKTTSLGPKGFKSTIKIVKNYQNARWPTPLPSERIRYNKYRMKLYALNTVEL